MGDWRPRVGDYVRWIGEAPNVTRRQMVPWFGTVLGVGYEVPAGHVPAHYVRSGWRELKRRLPAAHVMPDYPQHGLGGPQVGALALLVNEVDLQPAQPIGSVFDAVCDVDLLIETYLRIPSNADGSHLRSVLVGGDWSDEALEHVMAYVAALQLPGPLMIARCIRALHPHDRMRLQAARGARQIQEAAVRRYAELVAPGASWDDLSDTFNEMPDEPATAEIRLARDTLGEAACRAVFQAARQSG